MKLPKEHNYPKEILIGEETYRVQFCQKIPGGKKRDVGLADSGSHTIFLKRGMSTSMLFRTFIHEVIHAAVEFEGETPLPHKLVYKLEKIIADFLLMNF